MKQGKKNAEEPLLKRVGRSIAFQSLNAIASGVKVWRASGECDRVGKPQNVLVIQLARLGDMLLSTPLILSIKETLPSCSLSVVCSAWASEAIRDNPYVDEIHTYEPFWEDKTTGGRPAAKHFVGALRLWKWMKERRFDVCFVVSFRSQPFPPMFGWLSGAPVVAGFSYKLGDGFLTHRVSPGREHVAWENLKLLQIAFPGASVNRRLLYTVKEASRQRVREFLESSFLMPGCQYLCITPLAAQTEKLWRVENWARLIDRICDLGVKVVLAGAKEDVGYIDQILSQVVHVRECVSFAGKGTLNELAALMLNSQGIVTCESVPVHLAAALDVPCVALFSRIFDYEKFVPLSTKSRLLVKNVECAICMKGCNSAECMDFSVDEVFRAVVDLILQRDRV